MNFHHPVTALFRANHSSGNETTVSPLFAFICRDNTGNGTRDLPFFYVVFINDHKE